METGGGNGGKVWKLLCFVDEVQRLVWCLKAIVYGTEELYGIIRLFVELNLLFNNFVLFCCFVLLCFFVLLFFILLCFAVCFLFCVTLLFCVVLSFFFCFTFCFVSLPCKDEEPLWLCFILISDNSYTTQILSARNRSGSFVAQQVYQLLLLIGKVAAVFFKHTCSVMWGWPYRFLRVYQVLCDKMCSYLKVTFLPGAYAF